jgi:predicted dienelactone hydrolase
VDSSTRSRRLWRRIIKGVLVLAIMGILLVVGLVGSVWLEHRTEIALPKPTGEYAVGRVLYDWTDDTTVDQLAPASGTKRELLVWIWYPAKVTAGAELDDYLPASVRAPAGRGAKPPLIFRLLTRDLSKVHGHSYRDVELSPQQASYPVVVMRAGASAAVMNYSTLAEDLASHGYVVVGFDAPYRTIEVAFPDGRVIERRPENNPELYSGDELDRVASKLIAAWTGDVGFALDRLKGLDASDPSGRFTGRLDLTRVGVFGHSFGGATALQFCHADSRCKAGIDIDGAPFGSVIREGIHKPFMFLLSGNGDFSTDAEVRKIMADIHSIYDRLPPEERFLYSIRGANHFTFSDDGALLKSWVFRFALHLFGKLSIDGRRQLAVTAYCVHSFFDEYLKGLPGSRIKVPSSLYPELQPLQ